RYARNCYSQMTSFLDAYVIQAQWTGQIIDATIFPTASIAGEPELQKTWTAFQKLKTFAYVNARGFVATTLDAAAPTAPTAPARYLARLSQPVVDAYYAKQLSTVLAKEDVKAKLDSFHCNQPAILSEGLKALICYGVGDGEDSSPLTQRWQEL